VQFGMRRLAADAFEEVASGGLAKRSADAIANRRIVSAGTNLPESSAV
jgi:hypothetical protein